MSGHSHTAEYHSHGAQYIKILGILTVLTIITVAASRVDFGTMNIVMAMLIASVKALLVALFFMHLKYENPLTWVYALFPIVLLFLLIGLVFLDNGTRYGPDGKLAPRQQTTLQQDMEAQHKGK